MQWLPLMYKWTKGFLIDIRMWKGIKALWLLWYFLYKVNDFSRATNMHPFGKPLCFKNSCLNVPPKAKTKQNRKVNTE